MKKSATVGKAGNKQGPKVKVDTPYKDAVLNAWGGIGSPKPQDTNKGNRGK
jgi:hypothetical protein